MSGEADRPFRVSRVAKIGSVALAYACLGKMGLSLAIFPGYATAVWPPAGIALGATLLLGRSALPGVWLGSFLVNAWQAAESPSGAHVWNALFLPAMIALGAAAQAGAGAALMRRFGERPAYSLATIHNVTLLILATPLTAMINCTWSATLLSTAHAIEWRQFGLTWWTWWLGDSTGMLLFAPALLAWGAEPRRPFEPGVLPWILVNFVLLFLVGQIIFGGWSPLVPSHYPLSFAAYPLVIWSACQFGLRGSTAATLIVSAIALVGTASGSGPFGGRPINESLLLAQAFASMVSASSLILAASVGERDAAAERLRASAAQMKAILDTSFESIITMNHVGVVRAANLACERTFGYPPEAMIGRPVAELIVPPALREAHREGLRRVLRTGESEIIGRMVEMTAMRADGREFPAEIFIARIEHEGLPRFTAHVRDITARKLAERQLRHYATHDPLTGAANRTLFFETLRKVMAATRREAQYFALVYVDLDEFKGVNDSHGHAAGDMVLVEATGRIRGCLRDRDLLARLGGDEFVVLLNGLSGPEEADAIADRIGDALSREYRIEDRCLALSASLGIALGPREAHAAEDMIRMADAAMYSRKRARRGPGNGSAA